MLKKTMTFLGVAAWGVPSYVFRVQPMSEMCLLGQTVVICVSLPLNPMACQPAVLDPKHQALLTF